MANLITDTGKMQRALGWDRDVSADPLEQNRLRSYIAFQMASAGLAPPSHDASDEMASFSVGILESLREKNHLLTEYRAPIDQRIEDFLNHHFHEILGENALRLPSRSLTLDRHGMARELSLPIGGHQFQNELVSSYRCFNGVLKTPRLIVGPPLGPFMLQKVVCRYLRISAPSQQMFLFACSTQR